MKLSLKSVTDLAKSPQGKKVLRQVRTLDTPANRKKAMDVLQKMRGRRRP
jgi:hypothetical protein